MRAAGVDGAGVSVSSAGGSAQPVLSTDPLSALIEELQFTLGQGPCHDAWSTSVPVLVGDLTSAQETVSPRWPVFRDEVMAAGVRAIFAFPLGFGAVTVGTLDLYRTTPGPLARDALTQSLITADLVGSALMSDVAQGEPDQALTADPSEGLGRHDRDLDGSALRMTVHQAAGIVMVQTGRSIEDALLLLRGTAYGEGRTVHHLAAEVLAGHRHFEKEKT